MDDDGDVNGNQNGDVAVAVGVGDAKLKLIELVECSSGSSSRHRVLDDVGDAADEEEEEEMLGQECSDLNHLL